MGDRAEFGRKTGILREFLARAGYGAAILGRRDNFAWLTSGGDNAVVRSWETGFAHLVVTEDRCWLVGYTMDALRVYDDSLSGLDVEVVQVEWHEGSLEGRSRSLCGPGRILADMPVEGAEMDRPSLTRLHYPLSPSEVATCMELGAKTEAILRSVADELTPDMTEAQVARRLEAEYAVAGIELEVLLVGGGERLAKYRHPVPSDSRIGSIVLLHTAAREKGLHANVTRMVVLGGSIPPVLEESYGLLCEAEAMTFALCRPGTPFREIFASRRALLERRGFGSEWRGHFPGGTTGYILADGGMGDREGELVLDGQAFDWFITITGAKVEELSLAIGGETRVPSAAGRWPTRRFSHSGMSFDLPWVLVR